MRYFYFKLFNRQPISDLKKYILAHHGPKSKLEFHALFYAVLSTGFLFFLHHLPLNQLFIDPFSEAIKNHDIMDVALSKFRDHKDPKLFDDEVFIINSGITDRKAIAKTLEILHSKGASVIGIDLLLEEEQDAEADSILKAQLSDKRTILGYTFEENINHYSVSSLNSDPYFTNNVSKAYVNLGTNDGFSVRTFEPVHSIDKETDTAFAVKLVAYKHPEIAEALLKRNLKKEWINFRRKQVGSANGHYPVNSDEVNHYPSVFMEDFINNASSYDDDYFVNKIVLIGFMGENEKAYSMKDRYFTPLNEKYSGRSHPDMHGVLVHANIISMIQHADYINEVSEVRLYIIAFLLFFINFLFFDRIVKKNLFFTVATIRVIQIIQFILLFSLCIYLMSVHSIKVGFVLIITAVILSFELYEFYHKRIQKKIDIVFFK